MWNRVLVFCLILIATPAWADTLTPGQDSVVNMSLLDDVTISATGIVLRNCTIKGTLSIAESVRLIDVIVDGDVDFTAVKVLTAAGKTIFKQSETAIEATEAGASVVTEGDQVQFSIDCGLTNDRPTNLDCN